MSETSDVRKWAENLSEENLLCRDLGHNWKPLNAVKIKGGFERTLRCERCSTEKAQTLDSHGNPVKHGYGYAKGYLARPGVGRLVKEHRAEMRLVSLLRMVKD